MQQAPAAKAGNDIANKAAAVKGLSSLDFMLISFKKVKRKKTGMRQAQAIGGRQMSCTNRLGWTCQSVKTGAAMAPTGASAMATKLSASTGTQVKQPAPARKARQQGCSPSQQPASAAVGMTAVCHSSVKASNTCRQRRSQWGMTERVRKAAGLSGWI